MPLRKILSGALAAWLAFASTPASGSPGPPTYQPGPKVSGTIRSWGSAQMRGLMRLWETGFHRYQPQVRFEDRLEGTVSAMAGLYAGAADLALMGRALWPNEALAFRQMMGFAPSGLTVATGSFDVPTKADALVIFVHRDNPLSCLTFRQLDGIFGAEHLGGGKNLRSWGDVGLGGRWSGRRIDPYGYRIDNAAAIFFRNRVMEGSLIWNPAIRQFGNRIGPLGRRIDSGRQILDALAADRLGVAIANPYYANAQVKEVKVSEGAGHPCVAPSRETVGAMSYPLTRVVYIFFVQRPGTAIRPCLAQFLRYVLSPQGQRDVAREGSYMPLPLALIAHERRRLRSFSSPARPGRAPVSK